jgi:hypothetical protein
MQMTKKPVLNFEHLYFGFVSDFDSRVSDLQIVKPISKISHSTLLQYSVNFPYNSHRPSASREARKGGSPASMIFSWARSIV